MCNLYSFAEVYPKKQQLQGRISLTSSGWKSQLFPFLWNAGKHRRDLKIIKANKAGGNKKTQTKPENNNKLPKPILERPWLIEILRTLVNEYFVAPHTTDIPPMLSEWFVLQECLGRVGWCQKALCACSHFHKCYEKTTTGPEKPGERSDIQQMCVDPSNARIRLVR